MLFDLDGTITDPAPGIIGSVIHALETLGAKPPAFEALHWTIGPPLRASFRRLLGGEERVEQALDIYRSRYRDGAMFEATLYAGISEAIAALNSQGYSLVLATSKPHVFARPILSHFSLDHHFAAIHGAELDGRHDDKGELIGHILATERIDPSRALMIGDRAYDVKGAARHGIATIGALWGHGGQAELREAGAVALCRQPEHLCEVIAAQFPFANPSSKMPTSEGGFRR
ncbi:MAG: HAD hydrolase-like protein [Hyphomicrobiales bacterium]|nr:HAD hydrolase-like protein [Hyphomicrobiales bacterium]